MNLAEYRRALRDAHREYHEAMQSASDSMQKKIAVAEAEFLGDDEKAVREEDVAIRHRDRDNY